MSSNAFTVLDGSAGQSSNGRGRRQQRASGVAGATLKRAGLIDEDLGMRDASAAGPSRGARGRGRAGDTSGDRPGRGVDGGPRSGKARARANPMGARPSRSSADSAITGQAFGIRSATRPNAKGAVAVADLIRHNGGTAGKKGKGRVPGGGGGGAADALAARIEGGAVGRSVNGMTNTQQTTGKTIATLKQFLTSRFAIDSQFLNLEAMAKPAILLSYYVYSPGFAGAHKDIGSVMWKLCKEMFPNIQTLSLAKNDLKSLAPVSTLPDFIPTLRNLSLQDNDIKWVRDLAFHQARARGSVAKFNALSELILIGNPVHDNAVSAGNEQGYRAEVLARFPELKMLDQTPISQVEQGFAQLPGTSSAKKEQVGIAQGAANAGVEVRNFPLEIPKGNFVDEHAESIVPPFLAKYFQLFDHNRDELRPAYSADATFTIITASAVPPRARWSAYIHRMPRQKDLSWKQYRDVSSHNVMQLGIRPASKGFPRGPGAIIATFNKLPKTTHPTSDASKFVFDAWLLPNTLINATLSSSETQSTRPDALIMISIHGEFAEAPSHGVRSFSRTMLVAPVTPGSQAASLGWPCVIITDQLTVRQYSGTSAWDKQAAMEQAANNAQQNANNVPAQPSNGTLPAYLHNVTPAANLTADMHSLAIQLAAQTGLTYPFAVQCLQDNNWNASMAMERFQALKASGSIPAQAFATGVVS